ncbi:hypothetical protein VMC_38530 [Vibrio alginolyticus 40B]|nr:hypothetical protein VMC_38530 [Vibrio alginolyticus 40B]
MTKKTCISTFSELMDHEFVDCNLKLDIQGYKVDGNNGVKKHCNCNTLKSVDYFRDCNRRGFLMIEFSDLVQQDHQITEKIQKITDSNLAPSLKKEIKKQYYKAIHQELVGKCKDSHSIVQVASTLLNNVPSNFSNTPKYVVVVAPISDLDEGKKTDVIRLIDTIKTKLSQALPKHLYSTVHVLPLEKFAQ